EPWRLGHSVPFVTGVSAILVGGGVLVLSALLQVSSAPSDSCKVEACPPAQVPSLGPIKIGALGLGFFFSGATWAGGTAALGEISAVIWVLGALAGLITFGVGSVLWPTPGTLPFR